MILLEKNIQQQNPTTKLVRVGYFMASFCCTLRRDCGTTGLLNFYHSGNLKTYIFPCTTGTQQGNPLGGVLYTAPLQKLFNQTADKYPEILDSVFGPIIAPSNSSRYVQYAPCLSKSIPQFSRFNILLFSLQSALPLLMTMTTYNGLECTSE